MYPWIEEAKKHIGQREIPGKAENPWIVGLWKAIKRGGIKSEEVPWCAAYVGACLERVGIVSTRFESARSYATWGQHMERPAVGCIVVFSRQGGGHVGFLLGQRNDGQLVILGGNQGNAVSIASFPRTRVIAYRWPLITPLPTDYALPIIRASASLSEA